MKLHHTENAPKAIGPYSQAVSAGGFLFTAGQVGFDPASMEMVSGGFAAQARQVMKNLSEVLGAAGCTFEDVVKTTIFVADMKSFPELNAIYGEAMGDHKPARSTIEAAALPAGALVEIEMIARLPEGKG